MSTQQVKAIIGLGNPGPRFEYTRHNIGFLVVDALADREGASWTSTPLLDHATIEINDQKIILIKPNTFMNDSGKVMPFLRRKGIVPEEVVVVHDELEFRFGKVTMRTGGSARGHNGLRSIIAQGSPDFMRIRCGIDRPEDRARVGDYVLEKFSESPDAVNQMIEKALALLPQQDTSVQI